MYERSYSVNKRMEVRIVTKDHSKDAIVSFISLEVRL